MRKKASETLRSGNSIKKQLLYPVVSILVLLTVLIIGSVILVFSVSYTKDINAQNLRTADYIAEAVSNFMDGAYNLCEELVNNAEVVSMNGEVQHRVLASTVERNPYFETMYIQKMDGVQTGRSSGNLGNRRDRWWFKQLLQTGKPFISNSYYSIATNMPCASIFFPIADGGTTVGNVGVDLKLDYLKSLVAKYSESNKSRYSFIIDGSGVVMAHPDNRYIEELYNYKSMTHTVSVKDEFGNVVRDDNNIMTSEEPFKADKNLPKNIEKLLSGKTGTARITIDGVNSFIAYAPVTLKGDSENWGVITVQSTDSAFSMLRRIVIIMLAIGFFALLVATSIVGMIAKKITNPIQSIIPVIQSLAKGDFSNRIESVEANNEIDDIVTAFNNVSEEMQVSRNRELDLSEKLFEESQNLVVSTKETAATSQDSSAAVKEIVATMEDSNMLSESISSKIKDVASVAGQTSKDVSEGMAQIEQNLRQLHEIFDANKQTIDGIKSLSEKIESIWDIVTLINNVADQAKIIAFNAELEASTAGAAGKSFRIVANEIRRLSDGIIDGTREIKSHITEVQHSSDTLIIASESGTEKINAGYKNAQGLGEKFASIKKSAEITADSTTDISDIIQQQASASEQILIALKEIAGGVENFTVATDNISLAAENVRKISEDLNNASKGA